MDGNGIVYDPEPPRGGSVVASAPFNARGYEAGPITDPETDKGSMVNVSFYDKPPGKANHDVGLHASPAWQPDRRFALRSGPAAVARLAGQDGGGSQRVSSMRCEWWPTTSP